MPIAFADCMLDLAARRLLRAGAEVSLEPKMYQLLEVLIARRPQVVTNAELDELLWPNVYVSRASLARLVSELRSLIGDSPKESRIIRTVYKSGYAFCATLSSGAALPVAPVFTLWLGDLQWPLADGESFMGRGPECSVVVDAQTVSRRHARLVVASNRVMLEDLGSTNGTWVNGAPVQNLTEVVAGDEIALGKVVLSLKARDPTAPTLALTSVGVPQVP